MLAPGAFVQPCPGDRGAGAVAGAAVGAVAGGPGELGSEEEDLGLGQKNASKMVGLRWFNPLKLSKIGNFNGFYGFYGMTMYEYVWIMS